MQEVVELTAGLVCVFLAVVAVFGLGSVWCAVVGVSIRCGSEVDRWLDRRSATMQEMSFAGMAVCSGKVLAGVLVLSVLGLDRGSGVPGLVGWESWEPLLTEVPV